MDPRAITTITAPHGLHVGDTISFSDAGSTLEVFRITDKGVALCRKVA